MQCVPRLRGGFSGRLLPAFCVDGHRKDLRRDAWAGCLGDNLDNLENLTTRFARGGRWLAEPNAAESDRRHERPGNLANRRRDPSR